MFSIFAFMSAVALLAPVSEQASVHEDSRNGHSRMVNGQQATPGEFPFMVSLQTIPDGIHACGGTILDKTHILTAAHCCKVMKVGKIKVVCGSNSLSSGGTQHNISKITIAPDYDSESLENDICIIKLLEQIEYSDKIKPVTLCTKEAVAGAKMVGAGWGYEKAGGTTPDMLQKIHMNVVGMTECKNAFRASKNKKWYKALSNRQVCVKASKGDNNGKIAGACEGDSGGPIFDVVQQCQLGLWSFVIPCAKGYPDVGCRVSNEKYLKFVKSTIRE